MLVTTWVIVGVVAGISGVMIGHLALRQARATVEDCQRLLSLQISQGRGDLKAVRDVAVCQYDALAEMTGRMSFSVAMINGLGDGIVLTSINGRSETRTYVRTVVGGKGQQPLSPEEEEAVRAARLGLGPVVACRASQLL
ncbi:DUF4446 family protein [Nonomuraea gerenzanensis]|uniref:DUF4446 family protein n=1 Tax=Nonomuraea gerenzanensis TaxID=93944 RepID=UPI001CD9D3C5|nr:DUF4446 family protein [Nonomuraea gerenzanensis]UBU13615.1 DUF4446 family protein [Nonomuraea gerenzanensis]